MNHGYVNVKNPRKFSKIPFSRTVYLNFDPRRLLSLFKLTLQMTNIVHNQNMIPTKIVLTNFCEKLRKLLFMLANKI